MKKKRIVCLALCACLLMGCGGAPAATPEAAVSPAPAVTPGMDASPASPAGLAGQYAGRVFVTAKEFAALLGQEGVVAVDMQSAANYAQGHAPGEVNLQKNDILQGLLLLQARYYLSSVFSHSSLLYNKYGIRANNVTASTAYAFFFIHNNCSVSLCIHVVPKT